MLARAPAFGDNAPMPHPADFINSHRRHLEDADLLFDEARWPNADHLYGLGAECGLKAVMLNLGMKVDDSGTPREREHKQHVNDLWPAFQDFAQDRDGGAYLALLPDGEPFDNWSIRDRYASRHHFCCANVALHRDAAHRIDDLVQCAKLEDAL